MFSPLTHLVEFISSAARYTNHAPMRVLNRTMTIADDGSVVFNFDNGTTATITATDTDTDQETLLVCNFDDGETWVWNNHYEVASDLCHLACRSGITDDDTAEVDEPFPYYALVDLYAFAEAAMRDDDCHHLSGISYNLRGRISLSLMCDGDIVLTPYMADVMIVDVYNGRGDNVHHATVACNSDTADALVCKYYTIAEQSIFA